MKSFDFNFEKLKNFNAHVTAQLPWYDIVLDSIEFLVASYLPEKGILYDIGSGTGNLYKKILHILEKRQANYIGVDSAENMIKVHKELIESSDHQLLHEDIRDLDCIKGFDVCIFNLFLMFLPYSDQEKFLKKVLKSMSPYGVLICVEKQVSGFGDGFFRYAMDRLTMHLKERQGVSKIEILEKELALIGVQRPIRAIRLKKYTIHEWFKIANFSGLAITKHE